TLEFGDEEKRHNKQSDDVDAHQRHGELTHQQVGVRALALRLVPAEVKHVSAQVQHQPQGGGQHHHQRERAEQEDEGGGVESRVDPGGKLQSGRVALVLSGAGIGDIGGVQLDDDESQGEKKKKLHV